MSVDMSGYRIDPAPARLEDPQEREDCEGSKMIVVKPQSITQMIILWPSF